MKNYFCKFLPIEGEIDKNDTYYFYEEDNSINILGDCFYFDSIQEELNHINSISSYKKVKLFLCSRDIQVGDKKVMTIDSEFNGKLLNKEFVCKSGAGSTGRISLYIDEIYFGSPHIQTCFKVIGEISPEATWVKSGDKFDEEEIYRTETERDYDYESDEVEYYTNRILGSSNKKEGKQWSYRPIKIKGQCGHFH
jgi:hypothetical protein